MADYDIAMGSGQSWLGFLIVDPLSAGNSDHQVAVRNNVRRWIDQTQAEAVIANQASFGNTQIGDTALYWDSAITAHTFDQAFLNGDGIAANRASWTLTTRGSTHVNFYAGLTGTQKARIAALIYWHYEYGSKTAAAPPTDVLEAAIREIADRLRAAIGKTAAQLPFGFVMPGPYSLASSVNVQRHREVMQRLIDDPAFNGAWIAPNIQGINSDREAANTYSPHASTLDYERMRYWVGRGLSRMVGPSWAPTNYRRYSALGPTIYFCERVSDTQTRVHVRHDGGNALTVPSAAPSLSGRVAASAGQGWRVQYNGTVIAVSACVAEASGTSLLLTHAAAPATEMLRVWYGWGSIITGRDNVILDNSASLLGLSIPADATALEQVNLPLRVTVQPLRVSRVAPRN